MGAGLAAISSVLAGRAEAANATVNSPRFRRAIELLNEGKTVEARAEILGDDRLNRGSLIEDMQKAGIDAKAILHTQKQFEERFSEITSESELVKQLLQRRRNGSLGTP